MSASAHGESIRERSFARYLELFRRRWILLVVPMVVAMLVGGLTATTGAAEYRSSATVRLGDPSLPSDLGSRSSSDLDQVIETSIEIIDSKSVRSQVLDALPPAVADAYLDVGVSRVKDTVLLEIEVTATEATAAATIAQAWAESFVAAELARTVDALIDRSNEFREKADELSGQIDNFNAAIAAESAGLDSGEVTPVLSGLIRQRDDLLSEQSQLRQQATEFEVEAALRETVVEIVFPAGVPSAAVTAQPVRTALVSAILGLLLGMGLAVARDELDDRIRDIEGLELAVPGVPLLAAVPGSLRSGKALVGLFSDDMPQAEAMRALRTNFEFMCSTRPQRGRGRIVMVTSAADSEGKSTTAANLSAALVALGRDVILVDADLRRGELHRRLGLRPLPGLIQLGDVTSEGSGSSALQTLRITEDETLYLLAGGGRHPSPAELFSSAFFDGLLEDLATIADYVIVDAPPVLAVTDALVLGRKADDVMIVVAAGRTRVPQLRSTMAAIEKLDLPVLGFVFNGVRRNSHSYVDYVENRRGKIASPVKEAFDSIKVTGRHITGRSEPLADRLGLTDEDEFAEK